MSVSAFDHPVLSAYLGDEEAAALFSWQAELMAMLAFESALAGAEAAAGVIPPEAADAIGRAIALHEADVETLRAGMARDGVVVPELVRQLRVAVGEPHQRHVHFGATSQDVVDTGIAVRLVAVGGMLLRRLDGVVAALAALERRDGAIEVMAHTRMQAAIPVPAARKIASWRAPLERHRPRLERALAGVGVLSFGGAAGTLERLGEAGPTVAAILGETLGLSVPEIARHGERDGQAELAAALALISGSLAKTGQDIALAAQSELGEIRLAKGGGSSAMPHKVNPVGAEALVALGRFNATLAAGMQHAVIHENERSGAAWALEWMILPQMVVATAASLRTALELIPLLSFRGRG